MDQSVHDKYVEESKHDSIIVDADSHFIINTTTGAIVNSDPSYKKISLVQYDHNSERFSFDVDRIIEGHDVLTCNKIRVHYINTSASRSKSVGVYEVSDLAVHPTDDTKACFTWLISENATHYNGSLSFLISFECTEGDNVLYRWNSAINNTIVIAAGINNGNIVMEQYADELLKWENYIENHIDEIELELKNSLIPELVNKCYIERDFATSEEVAEVMSLSGEGVNLATIAEVVQETGQSTDKVMSQKAVTDALAAIGSGGGSGGSVTVDSELSDTSTNPVQNKVIKKYIDDIIAQINYVAPAISVFSCSPSLSPYKLPATYTLFMITHKETNVDNIVGKLTLKRGSTVLSSTIDPASTETTVAASDTVTLTQNGVTYTLSGIDKKGATISKTITISAYYTSYIGASENDTVTDALIESLTDTNSSSLSGTRDVNFEGTAKYIWFISTKAISSIKSGGFEVPFTQINASYTYNGASYKCYRTAEQVVTTKNSFVIT